MYSNYNNNKINNLQSSQTNSEQIITKTKLYLTNIFIIDWDDTLFPTSWISKNNIEFLSNENKDLLYNKFFYKLDIKLVNLFTKMNKCAYCNNESLSFRRLFFTDNYVWLCADHESWGK